MNSLEQQLWERINNFKLDKEGVSLSFSKRLARENGFSEQFAKEIVGEYKKFIFMCCISEHPVTPSNFVDLAWHLHLTYTKSYWIDLCQNTLQQEIHHTPTEGGKSESSKFKNCYEYALNFYEKTFNQKPNPDIWENTQKRFEINFINVDRTQNWIIPKIVINNRIKFILIFLICSIFLTGCSEGEVIQIFIPTAIIGVIIMIINKANNNPSRHRNDSSTNSISTSVGGDSGTIVENEDDNGDADGDNSDSGGDSGCSGCGGGGGD
jgi:hypothetical protein